MRRKQDKGGREPQAEYRQDSLANSLGPLEQRLAWRAQHWERGRAPHPFSVGRVSGVRQSLS